MSFRVEIQNGIKQINKKIVIYTKTVSIEFN